MAHQGEWESPFVTPSTECILEYRFTPENQTMMQGFEWYVPPDQKHWQRLSKAVPGLKAIGVNTMWIPPGCKASSPEGNGYDIYDLYDLGEFHQKGSRSTKWGSKEDLMHLVDRAEEAGIDLCWDAVLNHKAAADYKERCLAVKVDPDGLKNSVDECRRSLMQRDRPQQGNI